MLFFFLILELKFWYIFVAFLDMRPYDRENFKPLPVLHIASQLKTEFYLYGTHKVPYGILEFKLNFLSKWNFTITTYG